MIVKVDPTHSLNPLEKVCTMNGASISAVGKGILLSAVFFSGCFIGRSLGSQNGELLIQSVHGQGSYCIDKVNWLALAPGVALPQGAILRTEANSTADVIIKSSGTALRLNPST